MRRLAAILALLLMAGGAAAQTPTFESVTVTGKVAFDTGSLATIISNAAGGLAVHGSGLVNTAFISPGGSTYTAQQIYQMACPGCTGFVDTVQNVGTVPSSLTGAQQTGFASYFVDNAASVGGLHNAVGFFTVGVAAVDNAAVWGINTLLTDNTSQVASTGVGRIMFNEFDFNATSPNSTIEGIALTGASRVQPASANAVTCHALGVNIYWNGCLISQDGNVQNAMYVGLAGAKSGNSLSSQPILFESTDSAGNRVTSNIRATAGGVLAVSGPLTVAGAASFPQGLSATGPTTVPTPAQFDNSTNAATTAFVHAAGLQVAGQFVVSSTQALPAAKAGFFIPITAAGITITMPPAASVPRGNGFPMANESSGSVTLAPNAGDTMAYGMMPKGSTALVESDGSGSWFPIYLSLGLNGGGVPHPVYTVATLPTCNALNKGYTMAVSDATAPAYNAALTGGGAVSIPVYCNGATWTAH